MKSLLKLSCLLGLILSVTGCASSNTPARTAQKPERGPQGTIAYLVEVDSNEPGTRIEVNGDTVGKTPCTIKIFGDKDGTFHNFGSPDFVITAYPPRSNLRPQTKDFRTGGWFSPEDKIPQKIYFDFRFNQ